MPAEPSISEIFGTAFSVYRKNLGFFIVIAVLVFLPQYIVYAFLPEDFFNLLLGGAIFDTSRILPYTLVITAANVLFTPLSAAGAFYLSRATILKEQPTAAGLIENTISIWWKLSLTSLLSFLIISLSGILIVVPIYFAVSFTFASYVVVSSGRFGFRALADSRILVRGRFFRTLFVGILFGFMSAMAENAVANFFDLVGIYGYLPIQILSGLMSGILSLFFTACFAVWFIGRAGLYTPAVE